MKRIIEALCVILVAGGLLLATGAAGSVDLGTISIGAFLIQAGAGIGLLSIGVWLANKLWW